MCGHGIQAMGYVEASAVIYTHGCIDSLVNWINRNLFLLGGIALGLAAPQVMGGERGEGAFRRHLNDASHCSPSGGRIWGGGMLSLPGAMSVTCRTVR